MLSKKDIVTTFKAKTAARFHLIGGCTPNDIEQDIFIYLRSKIIDYGLEIDIIDLALSGSRCRGLEKDGSDLDIVVEYEGNITEDALFDVFHEDCFKIAGITVDINPIKKGKTGTLETYLPIVEAYLEREYASICADTQNQKGE